MQRVAPQLGQRRARQVEGLVLAQETGGLGLATRHQHHVAGLLLQAKGDRIVGGGIAGVQRRHHVNALRQLRAAGRLLHRQRQKAHARKTELLRQRTRTLHQFLARLDAVNRAALALLEEQVVDDEAQVGLAGTVVGQRDRAVAGGFQLQQDLLDKAEQVVDLLELAARILVQCAIARQDVQLLQQLDRLARTDRFLHLLRHQLGL